MKEIIMLIVAEVFAHRIIDDNNYRDIFKYKKILPGMNSLTQKGLTLKMQWKQKIFFRLLKPNSLIIPGVLNFSARYVFCQK